MNALKIAGAFMTLAGSALLPVLAHKSSERTPMSGLTSMISRRGLLHEEFLMSFARALFFTG